MSEIATIEQPHPLALFQQALDKGINPTDLGKLLDMHERVEAARAKREYAIAMNAAQAAMPVIVKDAANQGKRYASLQHIDRQIKEIYQNYGFSLGFSEEPASAPGLIRICCTVQHDGGHSERHWMEGGLDDSGIKGEANKTQIQAAGSSASYLKRYLKIGIFDLTIANDANDNDGHRRQQVGPHVPQEHGVELTREEIDNITALIKACADANRPVDLVKLLDWAHPGCESIRRIPRKRYQAVVSELTRKRDGAKP